MTALPAAGTVTLGAFDPPLNPEEGLSPWRWHLAGMVLSDCVCVITENGEGESPIPAVSGLSLNFICPSGQ